MEEVERARGQTLAVMQRRMGGDFGYVLGYTTQQGKLQGIHNQHRTYFALMSDTPSKSQHCGASAKEVHRNVLFESGHVRQIPIRTICWRGDQLYTNDYGQVAAGVHVGDTVIGSSGTTPIVHVSLSR